MDERNYVKYLLLFKHFKYPLPYLDPVFAPAFPSCSTPRNSPPMATFGLSDVSSDEFDEENEEGRHQFDESSIYFRPLSQGPATAGMKKPHQQQQRHFMRHSGNNNNYNSTKNNGGGGGGLQKQTYQKAKAPLAQSSPIKKTSPRLWSKEHHRYQQQQQHQCRRIDDFYHRKRNISAYLQQQQMQQQVILYDDRPIKGGGVQPMEMMQPVVGYHMPPPHHNGGQTSRASGITDYIT